MPDVLAVIFIVFLAAVGVFAIGEALQAWVFGEPEKTIFLLLVSDENSEDIEIALKAAQSKLRRMGGREQKKIVVLDKGMSEYARAIVRMQAADSGNILIVDANELQNIPL